MRRNASFGKLDLMGSIGFICLIVGVGLIHIPAAIILLGLGLMALAFALA